MVDRGSLALPKSAEIEGTVAGRKRVAVIGHLFVRRLDSDMQTDRSGKLKSDFGLAQCRVQLRGVGGYRVMDRNRFDREFAPFLRQFRPHIVLIQAGGNDLDATSCTDAQLLLLASTLDDIVLQLKSEFGVQSVYVCEPFTRERPMHVNRQTFENRRQVAVNYMATMFSQQQGTRFWRHRRIFGAQTNIYKRDGVHLIHFGQDRFYRSLRHAVMQAVPVP